MPTDYDSKALRDEFKGKYNIIKILKPSMYGPVLLVVSNDSLAQKSVIKVILRPTIKPAEENDIKLSPLNDADAVSEALKETGKPPSDDIEREIAILQSLKECPHIISLIEYKISEKYIYLVFPYYGHPDLCDYILSNVGPEKRLSEPEIRVILKQVISGLTAMNTQGWTHMDISPENILIESIGDSKHPENWKVRLLDMGASQPLVMKHEDIRKFRSHLMPGKRSYWAPETFDNYAYLRPPVSSFKESMVWSLGVTLFVIVTSSYVYESIGDKYYSCMMKSDWTSTAIRKFYSMTDRSEDLIHLMKSMVQLSDRIPFDKLLSHSWFL